MWDSNRPLAPNGTLTMDARAFCQAKKYIHNNPNCTYQDVTRNAIPWYFDVDNGAEPSSILVDMILTMIDGVPL